jgi:hypothetical protein
MHPTPCWRHQDFTGEVLEPGLAMIKWEKVPDNSNVFPWIHKLIPVHVKIPRFRDLSHSECCEWKNWKVEESGVIIWRPSPLIQSKDGLVVINRSLHLHDLFTCAAISNEFSIFEPTKCSMLPQTLQAPIKYEVCRKEMINFHWILKGLRWPQEL